MSPKADVRTQIFFGYLMDVVGPMASFYILHFLGFPPLTGFVVSSAIALVSTGINTVRQKKLDRVGLLVLFEIAVAILLLTIPGGFRIMLVRPSFYTAVTGIYLIATAFGAKPMTYDGTKQIASKGDERRAAAFGRAWERSAEFRSTVRLSSIAWGVAFLADAILRVVVVYRFPIEKAALLANVPHIAAVFVLIGLSALAGRTTKRLVEEQLAQVDVEEGISDSMAPGVVGANALAH